MQHMHIEMHICLYSVYRPKKALIMFTLQFYDLMFFYCQIVLHSIASKTNLKSCSRISQHTAFHIIDTHTICDQLPIISSVPPFLTKKCRQHKLL